MPTFESLNSAALGTLNKAQLLTVPLEVGADATAGLSFDLPFEIEIVDIVARSTATNASATVTVGDGTNPISNAMTITPVDTNTAASTIDTTFSTTRVIQLTTNGSADRCRVFVSGIRTQ